MVKPLLSGLVQPERIDTRTRYLFAQRERIVGAQHHPVHAADFEQVAQRAFVGDPGIEVQALQLFARIARVVGGHQVRAHVEAMLDAADGVRERAAAVGQADL